MGSQIRYCMELLELIDKQSEMIAKLVNENLELENMVECLMREDAQ